MIRTLAILGLLITLGACNTIAGAGRDVTSAGRAVTGAADDAKR